MNSHPKNSHLASLFLALSCAFMLCLPHASAQAVKPADDPMPPPRTQTPVPVPTTTDAQRTSPTASAGESANEDEDVVKLGRFEVNARSRTYYQDVTMAGTRIGSSLEDLGASITVITAEQMDDFGLLDINDIFNYEASTEGISTFTDVSVDINGQVTDGNMSDPGGANRIRALGRPNRAFANFEVTRMPYDRLLVASNELIRGPSSIIAGLGNPAGTFVYHPVTAHLSKNISQARVRFDSDNSFRQTLDLNRVIIRNRLAVRFQQMYHHQGYQRKPSGEDKEMYNFMVKYQPFKNTVIDATYVRYRTFGNRPNAITPGDGITPWIAHGEYTFDPTLPNTGSYYADGTINPTAAQGVAFDRNENPIVGTPNSNYLSARGLSRMYQTSGRGNTLFLVDRDGTVWWRAMRPTDFENDASRVGDPISNDWRLKDPAIGAFGNYQSGYGYVIPLANPIHDPDKPTPLRPNNRRGISDKNFYDWSSININATDRYYQDVNAIMVRLTQTLVDTQNQYLAIELGWFREDSNQVNQSLGGTGAAASYLAIDVNRTLLDGSENPNYRRPFLMVNQDVVTDMPVLNDTYRAQMAYTFDFRQNKNWTRWLGNHSFTGFAEHKQYETRRHRYRHALTSEHYWAPAGTPRATTGTGNGATTGQLWDQTSRAESRLYILYYTGDRVGYNIDYSPGKLSPGRYNLTWGNAITGNWKDEPATLGLVGDLQASFGINNNMRVTKGAGAVLQSHFLDNGVVTTVGYRRDTVYQKDGIAPRMMPDGINFDWDYNNRWAPDWVSNTGSTRTKGVVVKPAAWITQNSPKWLRWLRHASFFYNEASSLDLNVTQAFNLKGEQTSNPSGEGKDYGFMVRAFDNRLIVRFNRYENYTLNQRGNSNMATVTNRTLTFDIYESNYDTLEDELDWDEAGTTNRAYALNYQATQWVRREAMMAGEILTSDEEFRRVAAYMQMTPERLDTLQRNRTRIYEPDNGEAKGYELSVNFAVTDWLEFRLNGARATARNTSLAQGYLDYIDERWDFWQNLKDPITGQNWMTTAYPTPGGATGQSALSYYNNNIRDQWEYVKAQVGLPSPTVSKYSGSFQTRLNLRGITDHRILKGVTMTASVRYQTPVSIGNMGVDLGRYDSATGNMLYGSDDPANYDNIHDIQDPYALVYGKNIATLAFGISYKTKIFRKVGATFQLNINNILENGGIRAIRTDSNGIPTVYRIVDPRYFVFEARFDF